MSDIRIQMIRTARLKFGEAPRKFDKSLQPYLSVKCSSAVRRSQDQRTSIYREMDELLVRGRVVWANLVMANSDLFAKGKADAPGVVVYAPNYHLHDDLGRISAAAEKLSDLRDPNATFANEKEERIAKLVRDDYAWFTAQRVPSSLAGDKSLLASCVTFFRKHLPNEYLAASCFPIVVHPEKETIAVLPGRYWPQELLDHWNS